MKTYLDCIPCFAGQTLSVVRMVTDDEELQSDIMRRALRLASEFPRDMPPPAMSARMHRMIREEIGNPDPYREIKKRANEFALEMLPRLREQVARAPSAFEAALRIAIAGNLMDWGAKPHTDASDEDIEKTLEQAQEAELKGGSPAELRNKLSTADNVLYLADNAGEIAFDRLFISHIPCPDVTVAVRGGPIINDATMEDARQVDLVNRAKVMDTGCDAPGVLLDECSDEFRQKFGSADIVISKGQGNYETLSHVTDGIVFMLKAKCPVVARDTDSEVGDMLLLDRS